MRITSCVSVIVVLLIGSVPAFGYDSGVLDFENLSQGDPIAGTSFTGGQWRAGGRTIDGVLPMLTTEVVVRSSEQSKADDGWGIFPNGAGHGNVLMPSAESSDGKPGAGILLDEPITAADGMHVIEFDVYNTDDFMGSLQFAIGSSPYECCNGFMFHRYTNARVHWSEDFWDVEDQVDQLAYTNNVTGNENYNIFDIKTGTADVDIKPLQWQHVEIYVDLPADDTGDATFDFYLDGVFEFTGDYIDVAEGLNKGLDPNIANEIQTVYFGHNSSSVEVPAVFIDNVHIHPGTPPSEPLASPEPAALALLSLGSLAVVATRRRASIRSLLILAIAVLSLGISNDEARAYEVMIDFEDMAINDPIAGKRFDGGHWRVNGRAENLKFPDNSGNSYNTEIEKIVIVDDPVNPGNNVLTPMAPGGTAMSNVNVNVLLDEHVGALDDTHAVEFDMLMTDDTTTAMGMGIRYERAVLNASRGWYDCCADFRGMNAEAATLVFKRNNTQDTIGYQGLGNHFVDGHLDIETGHSQFGINPSYDSVAAFDIQPNTWHAVKIVLELKGKNLNGNATYDMFIDDTFIYTGEYQDAGERGKRHDDGGPFPLLSRFQQIAWRHGPSASPAVYIDNVHIYPVSDAGLACDFDTSGECNALDIDLLAAAVRNGTSDSKFNVDGLGDPNIPDDADFEFYITDDSMLSTGFGDHDLNFLVNFSDFVKLSNNFNITGTGWDQGNGNTDNITNFNDFVRLSNNFGQSFASGSNVPEPAALGLLGIGCLLAVRRRRP